MSDAIGGPLVGGLISLVSVLAGVWLTDRLRQRRERLLTRQASELAALDAAVSALKTMTWAALREAVLPMPWPNLGSLRLGQGLLHTDLTAIPDSAAVNEVVELSARLLWQRRFGLRPLLRWASQTGLADRQRLTRQLIAASERVETAARERRRALTSGAARRL